MTFFFFFFLKQNNSMCISNRNKMSRLLYFYFASSVSAFFDAVEHQDLDAAKGLLETNGLDLNW